MMGFAAMKRWAPGFVAAGLALLLACAPEVRAQPGGGGKGQQGKGGGVQGGIQGAGDAVQQGVGQLVSDGGCQVWLLRQTASAPRTSRDGGSPASTGARTRFVGQGACRARDSGCAAQQRWVMGARMSQVS